MSDISEQMDTLLDALPSDPDAQQVEDFIDEQARQAQDEIERLSPNERTKRRRVYRDIIDQLGELEEPTREQRYLRLLARAGLKALQLHKNRA